MTTLALPYKSFWWREILRRVSARIVAQCQEYGNGNAVVNDNSRTEGVRVTGPNVLIEDSFADVNGTLLPAHVIAPTNTPGTVWTLGLGVVSNHTIISNRATRTAAGALANKLDCGIADYTAVMDFFSGDAGVGGNLIAIRCREQDNTHRWSIIASRSPAFLSILESNGGNITRASAVIPWTASTNYKLRVILSGNSIYGAWEDATGTILATAIYISALFNTETRLGFLTNMSAVLVASAIDNFKVTVP